MLELSGNTESTERNSLLAAAHGLVGSPGIFGFEQAAYVLGYAPVGGRGSWSATYERTHSGCPPMAQPFDLARGAFAKRRLAGRAGLHYLARLGWAGGSAG